MDDNRLGLAIATELGDLLDTVPAARRVLPHLAALEQVLRVQGLDGVDGIPLAVLERALAQLRNLPFKPGSELLPQFLSLLDMAVQARQRPLPPAGKPEMFLPSFMGDDKLVVTEASHTDFERALEALDRHHR